MQISSNLVGLGFFSCHQLKSCQLALFERGTSEAPDPFMGEGKGKRQFEPLGHDIDGGLVGGASLTADDFAQIVLYQSR